MLFLLALHLRNTSIVLHTAEAFAIALPGIDTIHTILPNSITYPATFLAAFRTGAAISVINQPRMPSIDSSPYSNVGSTVLRLPERGTRVRLFYPTTINSIDNPTNGGERRRRMAPYCTDGRQTSDAMAARVGFEQMGASFLLGHLADASSGCMEDVPMMIDRTAAAAGNSNNNELPLLIYSHGYGGNMDMATYLFRTMASKGMIVAAIEHTDGTASSTILEDGSERRFNEYLLTGRQQLTRRASELLEASEVLPELILKRYNTTVGNIMVGGHSYGAPSAVMAANGASEHSNLSGLILHDPALGMGYGMLPPNGAKSRIPCVSYVSDEYHKAGVRYGDVTVHVRGARHGNFVDAPLWAPSWIMRPLSVVAIPAAGPADPWEVHEQLAESAVAFLESGGDAALEEVTKGNLLERV